MYFIHRTTQPGHYRFFLIPPKNPYSNQATQKNTCQIFVPKKIPESKISNPKKSFDHPRHLKSRVPPPGYEYNTVKKFLFFCFLPSENLAFSLAIFRKFCFFTTSPQKIWSSFLQPTSEIPCFCLLLWKILSAGGVY